MTLRRDLAGADGPLELIGGHILSASPEPGLYALERERTSHVVGKREAARHAAGLVKAGDTLFIDCGTTTPHLVEALPDGLPLTVVCYALNIANLLASRPDMRFVLLGGLFHEASATFSAEEGLATLDRLRINLAVVSAAGLHPTGGATCSNFNEVVVKQAAIANAERSILLVDASKLGRLTSAYFAPLGDFERIVTDSGATSAMMAPFGDLARFDIARPAGRRRVGATEEAR